MNDLAKAMRRYGRRGLVLLLCVAGPAATSGGLPIPSGPEIYLPRFEFKCSRGSGLKDCSDEELHKVGWTEMSQAERDLSDFTLEVFTEATSQDSRVKSYIRSSPTIPLKIRERELTAAWKRAGSHEDFRPWIIEVDIEMRERDCYAFSLMARRAGQEDIQFSKAYRAPWSSFSEVQTKRFPEVGARLSKLGRDILNPGSADEN